MSNQQQPRVIVNPQSLQRPPHPPRRGPQGPQAVRDIRQTKEYKIAARRYIFIFFPFLSPLFFLFTYLSQDKRYGLKEFIVTQSNINYACSLLNFKIRIQLLIIMGLFIDGFLL